MRNGKERWRRTARRQGKGRTVVESSRRKKKRWTGRTKYGGSQPEIMSRGRQELK